MSYPLHAKSSPARGRLQVQRIAELFVKHNTSILSGAWKNRSMALPANIASVVRPDCARQNMTHVPGFAEAKRRCDLSRNYRRQRRGRSSMIGLLIGMLMIGLGMSCGRSSGDDTGEHAHSDTLAVFASRNSSGSGYPRRHATRRSVCTPLQRGGSHAGRGCDDRRRGRQFALTVSVVGGRELVQLA